MPKFNERERAYLEAKLRAVGERLFAERGLAKVTVEELAAAAGIAKGSFYAFYPMKEALYFDILDRLQSGLRTRLQSVLAAAAGSPRRRLETVLKAMLEAASASPILARSDAATVEALARKLPPETLARHLEADAAGVEALAAAGLPLAVEPRLAAKLLQLAFTAGLQVPDDDPDRPALVGLLLSGAAAVLTEAAPDA
jgi:AcrR family transcriptional regulator